jgi:putative flippase GtrA
LLVPRRGDEQLHLEPALDLPRQRGHVGWQGLRFLIVAVVAYVANLALLAALIAFGVDKVLAQAIAVILVTPLNFIGNKLWSFRARR